MTAKTAKSYFWIYAYTALAAGVTAWLLWTVIHLPSHDAAGIMPAANIATAALLAVAGFGLMFSWRHIRFGLTDALAAFTAIWVAYNAAYMSSSASGYDEFAQAAMLYAAFRIIFSAEKRSKTAITLLLFCLAAYESVLGIKQVFGLAHSYHSLFRVTGTLFNPGPYAGLIVPAATCAAAYIIIRGDEIKLLPEPRRSIFGLPIRPRTAIRYAIRIAAAVAVVTAAVILPATMSRAAWMASGCAIALLAMFESPLPTRIKKLWNGQRLRTLSYMLAVMLPVLAAGIWAYNTKRPSADGRMLMWRIDMRIIGDNPLHGVGIGKFAGAFGAVQAEYFAEADRPETERRVAGCPEAGFNDYLQFGAETGLAGMAAMVAAILCAITIGLRRRDPCAYGLAAYAVFAMFSYPLSVVPLRLTFVILLAASASRATVARPGRRAISGGMWAAALVVSAAMWPSIYRRSAVRAEAHNEWKTNHAWMASERYDYIVEDGQRLYEVLKYDFRFLYDYGYALHKTGDYARSNVILEAGAALSSDPMFYNIRGKNFQALKRWEEAEECYRHAHRMIPSRIYPIYLLTMMYVDSEQYDKAVATARMALDMAIKVESEQTTELKRELQEVIDTYNQTYTPWNASQK